MAAPDDQFKAVIRAIRGAQPDWYRDALCQEYPGLDFFPNTVSERNRAKAVCADCLVREECLESALVNVEGGGVWGGTTRTERKLLRGGVDPYAGDTLPAADLAELILDARAAGSSWSDVVDDLNACGILMTTGQRWTLSGVRHAAEKGTPSASPDTAPRPDLSPTRKAS